MSPSVVIATLNHALSDVELRSSAVINVRERVVHVPRQTDTNRVLRGAERSYRVNISARLVLDTSA